MADRSGAGRCDRNLCAMLFLLILPVLAVALELSDPAVAAIAARMPGPGWDRLADAVEMVTAGPSGCRPWAGPLSAFYRADWTTIGSKQLADLLGTGGPARARLDLQTRAAGDRQVTVRVQIQDRARVGISTTHATLVVDAAGHDVGNGLLIAMSTPVHDKQVCDYVVLARPCTISGSHQLSLAILSPRCDGLLGSSSSSGITRERLIGTFDSHAAGLVAVTALQARLLLNHMTSSVSVIGMASRAMRPCSPIAARLIGVHHLVIAIIFLTIGMLEPAVRTVCLTAAFAAWSLCVNVHLPWIRALDRQFGPLEQAVADSSATTDEPDSYMFMPADQGGLLPAMSRSRASQSHSRQSSASSRSIRVWLSVLAAGSVVFGLGTVWVRTTMLYLISPVLLTSVWSAQVAFNADRDSAVFPAGIGVDTVAGLSASWLVILAYMFRLGSGWYTNLIDMLWLPPIQLPGPLPSTTAIYCIVVGWMALQMAVLASQHWFGPRFVFYLAPGWIGRLVQLRKKHDWTPTVVRHLTSSSTVDGPLGGELTDDGEDRQCMVYDCCICSMSVSVPVQSSLREENGATDKPGQPSKTARFLSILGTSPLSRVINRLPWPVQPVFDRASGLNTSEQDKDARQAQHYAHAFSTLRTALDPVSAVPSINDAAVTPCHHVFHLRCLARWSAIRADCPLCREPIPVL